MVAACYVINNCRDEALIPPDNWMLMLHCMSICRELQQIVILTRVSRKLWNIISKLAISTCAY